MKKFIVNITDDALDDMEALYNYIAFRLQSPEINRIADAIESLESFPERFGLFDTEPGHSYGIHKMVIDNYLVCYVIDPEIVTVTDVLYGPSNIRVKLQDRHG